jgi:indole-3-glycerol phosphate synthase
MGQFLQRIVERKNKEVSAAKQRLPLHILRSQAESARQPMNFYNAFSGGFACIAEIKRASPSRGTLAHEIRPDQVATEYERGGASAISVLTDGESFGGSLDDLKTVRAVTRLPVLRKEFIIDSYQIYEARAAGADAILLISEILGLSQLRDFVHLAREVGIAALVEGHSADAIERAVAAGAEFIGVNNRDLQTFELDLETSFRLRDLIPEGVFSIGESGLKTSNDLRRLRDAGYHGALVGEALMVREDREQALRELLQPLRPGTEYGRVPSA